MEVPECARNNRAPLSCKGGHLSCSPGSALWSLAASCFQPSHLWNRGLQCFLHLPGLPQSPKTQDAAKNLESIWIRKVSEKHLESVPDPARCIHFQLDFVIWVAMNQQEENFYSTCALARHCIIVCNTSRCWIIFQIALLCTFVPLAMVLSA